MKSEQVLDAYQKGDTDRRMSLFLYYRELRDEFICIDEKVLQDLSGSSSTSTPVKRGMFQRFLFLLHERSCCLGSRASLKRSEQ